MTRPYANDADFLTDASAWLVARSRRIGLTLQAEDDEHVLPRPGHRTLGPQHQVVADERQRLQSTAHEQERRLQENLEARLEAHRVSDRPRLGIDRLCEASGLGPQERLVLLVASVVAVSDRLAEQIVRPLDGPCMSRLTIEAATRLLAPHDGLAGVLAARLLFTPTSPLLRDQHLVVDFCGPTSVPDDWPHAVVSITNNAFATITGVSLHPDEGTQG